MQQRPIIIVAALNGMCPKSRNRHVPKSVEEIVEDAVACFELGASVIHIHASSMEIELDDAYRQYSAIFSGVLKACPGAHLYPTAIGGDTLAKRVAHFELLAADGLITMGSIDPGSVNLYAENDADGLPTGSFVFRNTFDDCKEQFAWLTANRIGPDLGIYEPGFLRLVLAYHKAGKLPPGTLIRFFFGGDHHPATGKPALSHGLPPTPPSLDALLGMMGDCPVPWSISVLGGDVSESSVTQYAFERGGHVRVGIEDYAGPREPRNAELVAEIVAIATRAGRRPATSEETARIMGIPRRPGQRQ